MKIIRIKELEDTSREVHGKGFVSFRALLASDNMGFSLHKTVVPKGEPQHWHYKQHLEACYCIKGRGILRCDGMEHLITPDVIYVLNNHDNHTFEALEDTVLISIFNPPVSGQEVHDEDGSYSLPPTLNRDKAARIVMAIEATGNTYDAIDIVQDILNGK